MKKCIIILLLLCILTCSCGRNNKPKIPVLNENGKEEIRLCILNTGVFLDEAIVEYNKQSSRYEIVPMTKGDLSYIDYRKRIQLDIVNGKGPDIMYVNVLNNLDMIPYVEDGYLMDVTDFINEQEPFVNNLVEYNELDGKIYGIPFSYGINTSAVKKEYQTSPHDWTKENCMKLFENSDITFGSSAYEVLRFFGVGKEGVQLFVDEENEISYFEDEEFIELLEFAKKYQYKEDGLTLKERIANDTQIITECGIQSFRSICLIEGYFKSIPCYMGYPTKDGGKHFLKVYSFHINNASEHKEGALDFMRFLLSDEQQLKRQSIGDGFTVKQNLLEKSWEEAKTKPYSDDYGYQIGNVFFNPRVMTDEEEGLFWQMLDNVSYDRNNAIDDIIYEETAHFFDGNKTAEEVAKIIDNRVQLYLDEKK